MLQLLHAMITDADRVAAALRLSALVATLVTVTVTELRSARVPDWLVGLVVALAIALCRSIDSAVATVSAAATGLAVATTARAATAGGLGLGDVKLSGALFALVGVPTALLGHLYAIAIALAAIGTEAIRERDRTVCEAGFQFGPFIVTGVAIAYLADIGWL